MATSSSRVCVAVPIYNGGPVLAKTLECLAVQTHQNLVVHLFDNGSTDETPLVLESFLKDKDPEKFKLFRSEKPTGMVNDWNVALRSCKGDYVKLLPADDILSPACIEKQVNVLDAHPEVGFVVSQKWVINQREEIKPYKFKLPEGVFSAQDTFDKLVTSPVNYLGEPGSGLLRFTVANEIGFFDSSLIYYPDLDYWLRALRVKPGYFLFGKDYFFRIHFASGTANARFKTAPDFIRLVNKHGLLKGRKFHKWEEWVLFAKARFIAEIRNLYLQTSCR